MGYRAAMQVKGLSLALLSTLSLTIAPHKGKRYIAGGHDTHMEGYASVMQNVK